MLCAMHNFFWSLQRIVVQILFNDHATWSAATNVIASVDQWARFFSIEGIITLVSVQGMSRKSHYLEGIMLNKFYFLDMWFVSDDKIIYNNYKVY